MHYRFICAMLNRLYHTLIFIYFMEIEGKMKTRLGYALQQTEVSSSFARLHLYFVIRSRAPATATPVAR